MTRVEQLSNEEFVRNQERVAARVMNHCANLTQWSWSYIPHAAGSMMQFGSWLVDAVCYEDGSAR